MPTKQLLPEIFDRSVIRDGLMIDVIDPSTEQKKMSVLRMESIRAPKGGATVKGKFYPGGQFIPSAVVEQMTEEEKKSVKEGGESKSTSDTSMPLSQLMDLADPNVPIDRLRKEERPYLDNLKRKISDEGLKSPLEVLWEDGRPQVIWEGMHRLVVLDELGMDDIPVKFVNREGEEVSGELSGSNFDKWFQDSKAVDKEGQPLTLYHGTDKTFDEFKGDWIYFSENPEFAAKFSFTDKPIRTGKKVKLHIEGSPNKSFGQADSEITLKTRTGKKKVPAIKTSTPGLVITESLEVPGEVMVTHAKSGLAFSSAKSISDAKSIIQDVAENVDVNWDQPVKDLPKPKSPEMKQTLAIIQSHGKKRVRSGVDLKIVSGRRILGEIDATETVIPGLVFADVEDGVALIHADSGHVVTVADSEDQMHDVIDELQKVKIKWDRPLTKLPDSSRTIKRVDNAILEGKNAETKAMFGYKTGAKGVGQGSQVKPVHLRAEKPLDLTHLPARKVGYKQLASALRDAGVDVADNEIFWGGGDLYQAMVSKDAIARGRFPELLKEAGYDAIKFNDYYDAKIRGVSWIVFDPRQVKSASGNVGRYDPEDPRTSMSNWVMRLSSLSMRMAYDESKRLRAPKGGVTIRGKFYPGGEWIPGDVASKLSDEERGMFEGKQHHEMTDDEKNDFHRADPKQKAKDDKSMSDRRDKGVRDMVTHRLATRKEEYHEKYRYENENSLTERFDPANNRHGLKYIIAPPGKTKKAESDEKRANMAGVVQGTGALQSDGSRKVVLSDVIAHLQDTMRGREIPLGRAGYELTSEDRDSVASAIADELEYLVGDPNSAIDWYERTLNSAMGEIREYLGFNAGSTEEKVFTAALAVTSNGQSVGKNLDVAFHAYDKWTSTGRLSIDEGILGGPASANIKEHLELINTLIDSHDADGFIDILEGNSTVGDLNKALEDGNVLDSKGKPIRVSGELIDEEVAGAVIFGPKLGSFYNNLNGNFDTITMDRWFMRTMGRMTGTLLDVPESTFTPQEENKKTGQRQRLLTVLQGGRIIYKSSKADTGKGGEDLSPQSDQNDLRDNSFLDVQTATFDDIMNIKVSRRKAVKWDGDNASVDGLKIKSEQIDKGKVAVTVYDEAGNKVHEKTGKSRTKIVQDYMLKSGKPIYELVDNQDIHDQIKRLHQGSGSDKPFEEWVPETLIKQVADMDQNHDSRDDSLVNWWMRGKLRHFSDSGAEMTPRPKSYQDRSEMNRSAKNLWENLTVPNDTPANGRHRRQIREIMRTAQTMCEDRNLGHIPFAAMQAALWYGEKDALYHLGMPAGRSAPTDYFEEAKKYIKKNPRATAVAMAIDVSSLDFSNVTSAPDWEWLDVMQARHDNTMFVNGLTSDGRKAFSRALGKAFRVPAKEDTGMRMTSLSMRMEALRAPKGGVNIKGTFYKGGEFIPKHVTHDLSKDEVASITQGDKGGREEKTKRSTEAPAKAEPQERKLRKREGLPEGTGELSPSLRSTIAAPPLKGLPTKGIHPRLRIGPSKRLREVAANYMHAAKMEYDPPMSYAKVDKERAKKIADTFESLPHAPQDPAVVESYRAMIDETMEQWRHIKESGLKVSVITEDILEKTGDPYAETPRLATEDIVENNHFWLFPTSLGYGSDEEMDVSDSPMLEKVGEVVDGHELVANDIFRIVHDIFGHAKEGVGFRAGGEENAWRNHSAMYSDKARPAMTMETRGQNSWVNFGPYGEFNRTASGADTHYADQKVNIMPSWAVSQGAKDSSKMSESRYASISMASEVSPEKAREILSHGKIHGKPLTNKQRKYFGAIASQSRNRQAKVMSLRMKRIRRYNRSKVFEMMREELK